jgi:uncharacterized protein (TIGR02145 family)
MVTRNTTGRIRYAPTIFAATLALALVFTFNACDSGGGGGGGSSSSSGGGNSSSSSSEDSSSSSSGTGSSSSSSENIVTIECNGEEYNPKEKYCSNGTVKTYGSVTDKGGNKYKTVVIGEQTWMAENLNYNVNGSKCYSLTFCETRYGRLYDWVTAMGLDSDCYTSICMDKITQPNHQGICPDDWHIPSNAEWDELFRYVDETNGTGSPYNSPIAGKHLKAKEHWYDCGPYSNPNSVYSCEDTYGFSAMPGGYRSSQSVSVGNDAAYDGYWWTTNEVNTGMSDWVYGRKMNNKKNGTDFSNTQKSNLYSIRCLQNH